MREHLLHIATFSDDKNDCTINGCGETELTIEYDGELMLPWTVRDNERFDVRKRIIGSLQQDLN